jgi:hypothetical protein
MANVTAGVLSPAEISADSLRRRLQQMEEATKRRVGEDPSAAIRTGDFPPAPRPSSTLGFDLDMVDETRRAKVRSIVESLPPVLGFLVEAAPATIGTMIGTLGGLPGAMAGGVGGEQFAQETGISPRTDFGLAAAAVGPAAGKLVGATKKSLAKSVGGAARVIPPARLALARNAMRVAVDEMESMATKIFANKQGYLKFSQSRLYKIAEESKVVIPAFNTTETRKGLKILRAELNRLSKFPEARAAISMMDEIEGVLGGSSVTLGELVTTRKLVGLAIDRAKSSVASKRLGALNGAKKRLFKGIADDVDHLATMKGKTGRAARIAQAATRRAKLEFAVTDLKAGIAGFLNPVEGKSITTLDIKGLRKWLLNATNKDHKAFNKQMTEALADDLPEINESLRKLSRFGPPKSAGGVGSLIIRGAGAGALGTVGAAIAGPVGAVIGVGAGAATPEIVTAVLSSPVAIKYLIKAAELGDGVITPKIWEIAGQLAAQASKLHDPQREFESPDFTGGG